MYALNEICSTLEGILLQHVVMERESLAIKVDHVLNIWLTLALPRRAIALNCLHTIIPKICPWAMNLSGSSKKGIGIFLGDYENTLT